MPGPRNSPKAFSEWYEADYFRRPRRPWAWARVVLAALVVTGAAVALTIYWPRAYQAGPLSDPHAFLADNCRACHSESFVTAGRLLPGHENDRSVPDDACLKCHKAGVHHVAQKQFVGQSPPDGSQSASDCTACHREHVGGASIARLTDATCAQCHADLAAASTESPKFADHVTSFDGDHPDFGAWRGKPLSDPGTLRFNHAAHLNLAKTYDATNPRNAWMRDALVRLQDLQCAACHEPDKDRKYMQAINYNRHCAACHPLTVPFGDPTARLHHPSPGESAANVRAELLQRFWKQLAEKKTATPPPDRPEILNRVVPSPSADDKERLQKQVRDAEAQLFAAPDGNALTIIERPLFGESGCGYCHVEQTTPGTRRDGLPVYRAPNISGRWNDVSFPHEKFGPMASRTAAEQVARDRWFPYSKFSHESHRMLNCVECHKTSDGTTAEESTKTSDVLMPTKAVCVTCHNHSNVGVRSDCLECHTYHDRGAEPRGLHGRMTVDEVIGNSKSAAPK
jgi:hypothetical protein